MVFWRVTSCGHCQVDTEPTEDGDNMFLRDGGTYLQHDQKSEDQHRHIHCCEKLKSHITLKFFFIRLYTTDIQHILAGLTQQ